MKRMIRIGQHLTGWVPTAVLLFVACSASAVTHDESIATAHELHDRDSAHAEGSLQRVRAARAEISGMRVLSVTPLLLGKLRCHPCVDTFGGEPKRSLLQ